MAVPCFEINLDDPPRDRWSHVVAAFRQPIQRICALQRLMVSQQVPGDTGRRKKKRSSEECELPAIAFLRNQATGLLALLRRTGGIAAEMEEELQGIASVAGVVVEDLAMLHLSYEACCACTAIVSQDSEGSTLLGRTLDWELPLLAELNVGLRVFKKGELLYTATSWAGYVGALTALRPGAYGLAINFRERPRDESGLADATAAALPVGILVRCILERNSSFEDACSALSEGEAMAPFYAIVAGQGEATILTRGCTTEAGARVSLGNGAKYLVQANMDHWESSRDLDTQESLPRIKLCKKVLDGWYRQQGYVSTEQLWELLFTYPIYEDGITLYSTVMNIGKGDHLSRIHKELPNRGKQKANKKRGGKRQSKVR